MAGTDDLRRKAAEAAAGPEGTRRARLAQLCGPDLDLAQLRHLARRLKECGEQARELRVALLFAGTADQLVLCLETFLLARGVSPVFHQPPFASSAQEILDPGSGLYAFKPRIAVLAWHWRDFPPPEGALADAGSFAAALEETKVAIRGWWERLGAAGIQVLMNDLDPPPWDPLGHFGRRHQPSRSAWFDELNRFLRREAPESVVLHGIESLSAELGAAAWHDQRFWTQARVHPAPAALPAYGHSLAAMTCAILGLSRKCLVLDLDGTLWHGVVGDDGLSGIRVGEGDPVGEAHADFQRALKRLKERGIVLAVCSKNDEANAKAPFERHPGMVLRLEDLACFMANWEDKATNIRRIAETLDLGLDSFVFLDDNPMERDLVRRLCPQVAVPELGDDPSRYEAVLMAGRHFETVSLGAEDLSRAESYRAEASRRTMAAGLDLDAFLAGLAMELRVDGVDEANLARLVQLVNKTNQFNLCTRRTTAAEVQERLKSGRWHCFLGSLRDRFGDSGMIAVVSGEEDGTDFRVDNLLMSCRVLRRGVEQALLGHVAAWCRGRGLRRILAEYLPTEKNGMVKDLLPSLGFTPAGSGGHALDLATFVPPSHHIRIRA